MSDPAAIPSHRGRRRLLPVHHSSTNVAGAIYGLILAGSVIGAASEKPGQVAAYVDIYLIGTLLIFYLAHVYSQVLATWIREQHVPTRAEVLHELRSEWAMVTAPLLPILILAFGIFDAVDDRRAIDLALGVCLVQLTAAIVYAARRGGANRVQTLASVVIGLSFGFAIVALKVLVK
ncbi:MAG: hypothetical protein MUF56_07565 [Solirubrobacteraceae bacterium]|nr:hypothetical protein [Solirubrobacteraceae bacterium]